MIDLPSFNSHITDRYWRFAKTMPESPHWYTVKKDSDDTSFVNMVKYIRSNGEKKEYGGSTYTYFHLNGFKYWTMFASDEATTIINRAYVEDQADYDKIALQYDSWYIDEKSLSENRIIAGLLGTLQGNTLDIGCGTGLLQAITPINGKYTGIDPSLEMLKIASSIHGNRNRTYYKTTFEDFYPGDIKYDNVIGLFSCSYIENPKEILNCWNGSGKLFLMFFNKGYTPVSHSKGQLQSNYKTYTRATLEKLFNMKVEGLSNNHLIVSS